MTNDDDRYLSIAELVQYSSLSERGIRRYLASRIHPIPTYRVNGRVLVKRSEFDQWVKARHAEDLARRGAAAVRGIRGA